MTNHGRRGRRWRAAGCAALVATVATVAGSLAPTVSAAFASSAPKAAPTDAIPNWNNNLSGIKALAAEAISIRLNALAAAIKSVQGDNFLGSDGTTLVNDMQSDITGLQALGTKINADTTVAQAIADADLIFTEFRVYYVMLPVVHDVTTIDHIVNVDLPALSKDITTLQGEENSSNQPFIGPLVSGTQSEVQIATGATTGLVADLLAYTPAEWDSNHRLFSTAQTAIQTADRAVDYANDYLARANKYLQSHPTTTTTTSTSTTTTSSTTTTTAPTTTTTSVPGSSCTAAPSGSQLDRTGWSATSNAPYGKADVPAHALDGKLTTRFSTNEHQAPGLYFQVDMRAAQTFDAVEMDVPNSPNDYARGYYVEVWNGSSWVTVANCTGTSTTEVASFPTQTSQYIRVVLTASTGFNWWSIDEFNVFGSPLAGTSCAASPSGNALPRTGWVARSNAPYGKSDIPANALDGNLTTRFSSNERQVAGLYFQVDMRAAQSFDEVELDSPNSPNDYARGYDVDVWNGHSWVTVASCTGAGTPEIASFPTQTSQYIRVVTTAATGSYWWSIDEFNVYTSSTIPTTTTTTVAPTTTTTVAPTTTTTSPGNSRQLRRLKAEAAQYIYVRIRELAGAVKGVQDRPWLGSDGTALINTMQSDISGLEALGNKIQGDTTVPEVEADTNQIFTQYRVFYLEQPVVADVIRIDRITDITLPYLAKEISYLQSRENQHNQGVIGPLVANMQSNDQTATSETNGLSTELISFTPAEWNANHRLLNGPTANMLIAARAVGTSERDLAEALHYLNGHHH
ncbi:MAG TPA: discoidin domain-containing protein [Acidimicrobiales bacterium]|nr:discoidin domain-containing protein [Acidimicrobiales bacterium]